MDDRFVRFVLFVCRQRVLLCFFLCELQHHFDAGNFVVHFSVGLCEFCVFTGLRFEVEFEFGDDLVDLLDLCFFGVKEGGVFGLGLVDFFFHLINKFFLFSKGFLEYFLFFFELGKIFGNSLKCPSIFFKSILEGLSISFILDIFLYKSFIFIPEISIDLLDKLDLFFVLVGNFLQGEVFVFEEFVKVFE